MARAENILKHATVNTRPSKIRLARLETSHPCEDVAAIIFILVAIECTQPREFR